MFLVEITIIQYYFYNIDRQILKRIQILIFIFLSIAKIVNILLFKYMSGRCQGKSANKFLIKHIVGQNLGLQYFSYTLAIHL